MQLVLHGDVAAKLEGGSVRVDPRIETKRARAMWGPTAPLVANLIERRHQGLRAQARDQPASAIARRCRARTCRSQLGYAHDIVYPIPEGITIAVPKPTEIVVTGIDRAEGRPGGGARSARFRKPEPYKGKGVKYAGEFIFRKEGKKK